MFIRQMRPRFCLPVRLSPDQVVEKVDRRLRQPDCPCRGAVAGNHQVIELNVHDRDRNFWSPSLSVTVAGTADGGSVVHGLVGPNPDLWTLFTMAYMGLMTLLMFVGMLGVVQWGLGLRPWGLFGVPVLIAIMGLMHVSSRIGQRLAAPQTAMLRHFLEDSVSVSPVELAVTDRDRDDMPAASR
jgi:hypothetical protein